MMTAVSFSSSRDVSVARHLAGGRSPSQRRSATRSEVFFSWQSSGSTLQYPDAIISVSIVSVSSASLSSPSAMSPAAARGWRGLVVVVVLVTMLYRGMFCYWCLRVMVMIMIWMLIGIIMVMFIVIRM